ncbi:MAG TPA: matrixin family metalloprotease [Verrucomicrobiae bacterium]|nr:matrixin family metalloprotease [Verrucomicrobiae bacterium]
MKPRPAQNLVLLFALSSITAQAQVTFQFDYSLDANNFFSGPNIGRRTSLEAAATALQSRLADNLSGISPSGGNSWTAVFANPATGTQENVSNPTIAPNILLIYAGGRDLGTTTLGVGGFGGFGASGTQAWLDTVSQRGQSGAPLTEFGPWGGAVTFDIDAAWYFDADPSTVEAFPGQNDFHSVALHELGHMLGIGTAASWTNLVNGANQFTGSESVSLNGGPVPLESNRGHWLNGTTSTLPGTATQQEVALDPSLTVGTRKNFTDLDFAGLNDLGWTVIPIPEPRLATLFGLGLLAILIGRRRK